MRLILGWIAFAKRPLRKSEFRSALAFSAGDRNISELPPQDVFNKCVPLVEERCDSTFAFIHVSVKEWVILCPLFPTVLLMPGSFLQSPESNVVLNEETALSEQGLAAATCLLSGYQVFVQTFQEHFRLRRVVSSLHAFHIYATQYWLEYLLSSASSANGMDVNSKFFSRSCELSKALKQPAITAPGREGDHASHMVDDNRLENLRHWRELWEVARSLLLERRSRHLAMPEPDNGK